MAGLVPAIHAFPFIKQGVDARHKAGHDVEGVEPNRYFFIGGANFAGTISEVCCSISKPDSDSFFT